MSTVKIYVRKTIEQDYTRELIAKVTFSVVRAENITSNIIVCSYIPPNSQYTKSNNFFHHISYIDELDSVPLQPPNPMRACYIRTSTVVKYFPTLKLADEWCQEVYKEVQRLSKQFSAVLERTIDTLTEIDSNNIDEQPYEESSSSSCSSSISSSSSSASTDTQDLLIEDDGVLDLGFDGTNLEN